MVFQGRNIRNLYEITDAQFGWLDKIEEMYYKAQSIMIAIMHKEWLEILVLDGEDLIRFPISETDIWDLEMEQKFDSYCCSESVYFAGCSSKKIYNRYMKKSGLNLSGSKVYGKVLIAHIYHAMHQTGPAEFLFKAGIDYIALHWNEYENINLMASNAVELFEGLNMRTLRSINSKAGYELLCKEESRNLLRSLQKSYSWIFDKKLTYSQVEYLLEVFQKEVIIDEIAAEYKKQMNLFRKGMVDTEEYYNDYLECMNMERSIERLIKVRANGNDKNWASWCRYRSKIRGIYKCLYLNPKQWDDFLCIQAKENSDLEYSDDRYVIFSPRSKLEFCEEALQQNNCVMEYINEVISHETKILFLRRKSQPYKSFITIEIWNECILQALTKYNKEPDDEVKKWSGMYAEKHHLIVDERAYQMQG